MIMTVTRVKRLSTGHVRVDAGGRQFALLPEHTWEAMEQGEIVPDEFTFEPEWCRMRKGDPAKGGVVR